MDSGQCQLSYNTSNHVILISYQFTTRPDSSSSNSSNHYNYICCWLSGPIAILQRTNASECHACIIVRTSLPTIDAMMAIRTLLANCLHTIKWGMTDINKACHYWILEYNLTVNRSGDAALMTEKQFREWTARELFCLLPDAFLHRQLHSTCHWPDRIRRGETPMPPKLKMHTPMNNFAKKPQATHLCTGSSAIEHKIPLFFSISRAESSC